MIIGGSSLLSNNLNAASLHLKDKAPLAKKLKTALGYDMIKEELSLVDKFKLIKDLGFDGVEFNSPVDIPIAELIKAKSSAGIEIPSVVNKDHWQKNLSDPNEETRKFIIGSVAKSLQEVKELGGDTVLVVPGVVNDKVSYAQAYTYALDSVRKLIPYVEKTGMKIGLENVWNNFLISPLDAKRFIDEVDHPLIGWYFDIGNVLRYGWPEHWIDVLGKHIVKLHAKEFNREIMNTQGLGKGFGVELLQGDIDWPKVMQRVQQVNYKGGWITAEIPGGNRERLKTIASQMNQIASF